MADEGDAESLSLGLEDADFRPGSFHPTPDNWRGVADLELMRRSMETAGLREGLDEGKHDTVQRGFDAGFAEGLHRAFARGFLEGALVYVTEKQGLGRRWCGGPRRGERTRGRETRRASSFARAAR